MNLLDCLSEAMSEEEMLFTLHLQADTPGETFNLNLQLTLIRSKRKCPYKGHCGCFSTERYL